MSTELDLTAFWQLSYGLYLVSACCDGKLNGQISNTVFQVTDDPARIVVSINKQELTHEYISKSGYFGVSVLDEKTPMQLIGLFGFKSGRNVDKLSQVGFKKDNNHCPLVTDHAVALLEAKLEQEVDLGTHTLFVGKVVFSETLTKESPMTYAYYHDVKKGKTPEYSPLSKVDSKPKKDETKEEQVKNPDYVCYPDHRICKRVEKEEKRSSIMKKYVCNVCGYIYDPAEGDPDNGVKAGTKFEDISDDWLCPICGVGKEEFSEE